MEDEIWKPVIGLENFYNVSNFGRVKTLRKSKRAMPGYILTPRKMKTKNVTTQYIVYTLTVNGKQIPHLAHKLVANSFLGIPKKGFQINHIDKNKSNNRIENLEYVTPLQNSRHSNIGSNNPSAKLKDKDIPKIRILINLGISKEKIGKMFCVSSGTISNIKRNKHWNHIK